MSARQNADPFYLVKDGIETSVRTERPLRKLALSPVASNGSSSLFIFSHLVILEHGGTYRCPSYCQASLAPDQEQGLCVAT